MDDVNEKWMYFSFDSEEQLREHYPKENFPDLVSGHRVESPNGKQTTYYSLLARDAQNEQWVSATSDPR